MAKDFRLQDQQGGFVCMLTKAEAASMRNAGKISKVGKYTYRQTLPPEPSNSRESASCLTGGNGIHGDGGDMLALAGRAFADGRLTPQKRERFIGWGLLPMPRTA